MSRGNYTKNRAPDTKEMRAPIPLVWIRKLILLSEGCVMQ